MILKDKKSSIFLKITKYIFVFTIAFVLINSVFAVDCTGIDKATGKPIPDGCTLRGGTPDKSAGTPDKSGGTPNVNITTGIKNPLGDSFKDIPSFIEGILNFVLLLGIPIVTLAIIYCGFLFVTASGNSEKLKKAKQALLYTLIGAALLLGSFVIAKAIGNTVDEVITVDKSKN